MTTRSASLVGLVLSIALSACSAASAPPAPEPTPSPGPSDDTSTPGAVPPDGPIVGPPGGSGGGGGGGPIDFGKPTVVLPKPGQKNVHPVAIEQLSARVEGHHVVLNARWWSGVEPCSVLDSVAVKQDGRTITVSVREGSSDLNAACIEIAMFKVTPIDLGDLEPGDYIVAADQGPAPAITVTVG